MTESKITTESKTTKEEDGSTTVEITMTREPNEMPDDTYWGVAKQIVAEFGLPPEAEHKIKAKIKRLGHYEKLDVYSRLERYASWGENASDWFKTILNDKVETHKIWSKKPDAEIVT